MKHRSKRSASRNAVSLVFGFFLSLSVLFIMILLVLRIGVVSRVGFVSVMDNDYYRYTLDYIEDQARYYTLPTGIDPTVLEGVFSIDEVRNDVDGMLSGKLNGSGYNPKTDAMSKRLSDNVYRMFAADGVAIAEGSSADEIVTSYVDEITSIYKEAVTMPGIDMIVRVREEFRQWYVVGLVTFVALSAVLIASIVRLHHYKHRALRYISYSVGGASLMGFVLPLILLLSGFYKGLSLSPQHFYHFGVSLISRVLTLFMIGAGVLFALMLIIIVIATHMRTNAVKKHRRRSS